MKEFIRVVFFIIFFGIGAAAFACALLFPDIVTYYHNKQQIHLVGQAIKELEELNVKYEALLENIEKNPDMLKRIAPAVLGSEPAEPNTVYPDVTPHQVAAIKQALKKIEDDSESQPVIPQWLERLSEPPRRMALLLAGVALIFVAFICFGPKRDRDILIDYEILED